MALSSARSRVKARPNAFTLVELLVVIGIIALLISVLLPALNKARASAQSAACTAAMRQVGTAGQLHVQNHRGYYPLAGYLVGPVNGEPSEVGDAAKAKYSYIFLKDVNRTVVASWHTALAQYMTKRRVLDGQSNDDYINDENGDGDFLRFFICPSDVTKSDESEELWIHGFTGNPTGGRSTYGWVIKQSYIVNEGVFGMDDARGRLRGQASKIGDTARTMMMADGKGTPLYGSAKWVVATNAAKRGYVYQGKTINSYALKDVLAPAVTGGAFLARGNLDKFRHKGKINILFFDGHCETRNITAGDLADVYILPPSSK